MKQSPDVNPFTFFPSPVLTPLKGRVYFFAPYPEEGPSALWRADASGEGARPFRENVDGPLLKAGDLLYFVQNGSLWASDGTERGTRRIKELGDIRLSSDFADVRGRLFFPVARDTDTDDTSLELWVSDGSPGGTRLIASFPSEPYVLTQLIEFRGRLFFLAADAAHGLELWTSDGTTKGTRLFKDIAPGPANSYPFQLTVVDNSLYFVADDQVHGEEPWTTRSMDPARTFLVKDFVPGPGSSHSRLLAGLHGDLYLTLHPADEFNDLELWRTDGWPHATVRVKRFSSPDPLFAELWSPEAAITAGNRLYFLVQPLSTTGPGAGLAQLWRTNGTSQGTRFLTERLTFGDEGPIPELFAVDDTVLFPSWDNLELDDPRQHGQELWRTEGSVSSTRLLQDLRPGPESSYPSEFVRAGRYVYFITQDVFRTYRLWALPVESVRCSGSR
ncbi:hypothetical protein Q664_34875 [Archangium violaceum Cb vi76]|uniref:Uncharacterized protein n=1 Tax=Archangium violaceum Cb vi76 TaxID=1406225 RepID=A0A084SLT8_9BACT|nr:hypothetical protein Q664_34875 [Archangium violaceum Cb vi76]